MRRNVTWILIVCDLVLGGTCRSGRSGLEQLEGIQFHFLKWNWINKTMCITMLKPLWYIHIYLLVYLFKEKLLTKFYIEFPEHLGVAGIFLGQNCICCSLKCFRAIVLTLKLQSGCLHACSYIYITSSSKGSHEMIWNF